MSGYTEIQEKIQEAFDTLGFGLIDSTNSINGYKIVGFNNVMTNNWRTVSIDIEVIYEADSYNDSINIPTGDNSFIWELKQRFVVETFDTQFIENNRWKTTLTILQSYTDN